MAKRRLERYTDHELLVAWRDNAFSSERMNVLPELDLCSNDNQAQLANWLFESILVEEEIEYRLESRRRVK